MMRSVQARVRLESVADGVAYFGRGSGVHCCAVLEVTGAGQQSLATADEPQQEVILAAYAQLLNALDFPFQVLVRSIPVDLSRYVERMEERTRLLPSGLAALARDHAAFVLGLASRRTLLERHHYVVLPADGASPTTAPGVGRLCGLVGLGRRREPAPAHHAAETTTSRAALCRHLTFRCEQVARQLGRAGLETTRLDDTQLAQLYHACWAPDAARSQRIRRAVSEYTTLAIAGSPRRQ
jgi:hypothetical protein